MGEWTCTIGGSLAKPVSASNLRPAHHKDLSPDQKTSVESLLGRTIAPHEAIIVQAIPSASVPGWLQESWESALRQGLDQLTSDEIDGEIAAARKARRESDSTAPLRANQC